MGQLKESESKLKGLSSVSLLTLVSRITGLGRDSLMAALFGTGWILDAFSLAFRLPNMFRRLFGEGAMTAAFLPEFVKTDDANGRAAATELFSATGRKLMRVLLAFTLTLEVAVASIYLIATLSERSSLLCELAMILGPFIFVVCLSGFYAAALNGVNHFFVPAMCPVLLNLVWLGGGLVVAWSVDSGPVEARCIALCIVTGGIVQLLTLRHRAATFGIFFVPETPTAIAQSAHIFRKMIPVLIGLSITQVNAVIDSALAWGVSSPSLHSVPELLRFRLPEGTAGALYLGQRLFQFPMGVFAVALGTVLFPRFARHAQSGDRATLGEDVIHGLQLVLIVGVPASIGLWMMATPITELLFRYGQFDAIATQMTAEMIAYHGTGVFVFSGLLIVNRVYYALGDQSTPMRQGVACVGLNLIFDVVLLPILGAPSLPLASVIATSIQLAMAVEKLRRQVHGIRMRHLRGVVWRVVVGSVCMWIVVATTLSYQTNWSSILMLSRSWDVALPVGSGMVTLAVVLKLTGLSPVKVLKAPQFIDCD